MIAVDEIQKLIMHCHTILERKSIDCQFSGESNVNVLCKQENRELVLYIALQRVFF
jgi:hypothetical protein